MAAAESKTIPLIQYLESLAQDDNRASLAALRASLRPGQELTALRFVIPYLPVQDRQQQPLSPPFRKRQEDDAILLAGLFALHPESGHLSLARALNNVRRDTDSESIEGRFRALLSASRSDLAPHLRHAVSLVAGHKQSIDWGELFNAIRYWDHENARSRRSWARDFWTGSAAPSSPQEIESTDPSSRSTPV